MTGAREIYFAGSITGGREDAALYGRIVEMLRPHGRVLTEHIGSAELDLLGEVELDDEFVHDRDVEWLGRAHVVVAEVTQPSTGTGYEIGRAVSTRKPVLCLYREVEGRRLTRMISGNRDVLVRSYRDVADLPVIFDEFFARY
jgi:nucleoside 2-deoxyribosyltransferase